MKKRENIPIGLTEAAKIITRNSGHHIDRDGIRNQIRRKKWPYPHYKLGKEFALMLFDVEKYAKNFKGLKVGRPSE